MPHMLDVKLLPLVGGTVIDTRTWDRLPAEHRDDMLEAAYRAGSQLRDEIRQMGDDSVTEMAKRGLTVNVPDASTLNVWRSEVERAYSSLRGEYCPAEIFDEVLRLRDDYRAAR